MGTRSDVFLTLMIFQHFLSTVRPVCNEKPMLKNLLSIKIYLCYEFSFAVTFGQAITKFIAILSKIISFRNLFFLSRRKPSNWVLGRDFHFRTLWKFKRETCLLDVVWLDVLPFSRPYLNAYSRMRYINNDCNIMRSIKWERT